MSISHFYFLFKICYAMCYLVSVGHKNTLIETRSFMLDFIFVKDNERFGALLYSRASIRNKGESVSILRYCLDKDVKYFLNILFYILRL